MPQISPMNWFFMSFYFFVFIYFVLVMNFYLMTLLGLSTGKVYSKIMIWSW